MTYLAKILKMTMYIILTLSTNIHIVQADVPSFDVAEIVINEQHYYVRYENTGEILGEDFCYYDAEKTYLYEAKDKVVQILQTARQQQLFKELHRIKMTNVPFPFEHEYLYVFKQSVLLDSIAYDGNFELINVEKGNFYGYQYSEDLSESDNIWLSKYPIERLFDLYFENCEGALYGIANKLTQTEKEQWQKKLMKLLKARENEAFTKALHKLHQKHIIMIWQCSC